MHANKLVILENAPPVCGGSKFIVGADELLQRLSVIKEAMKHPSVAASATPHSIADVMNAASVAAQASVKRLRDRAPSARTGP